MVFGKDKDKKKGQEENEMAETEQNAPGLNDLPEHNPRLDPSVVRAVSSIIKTVDMFKDTAQDVLDAEQNKEVSMAELKDLVSRCKSYSLIVEKEFKIMRRRMQAK